MLTRTRLLWFALGFSSSGAAISYFVWKDLANNRFVLASEMKRRFDSLDARVLDLELLANRKSEPEP